MEYTNKTDSKVELPSLVRMSSRYNLKINDILEQKIRFMCSRYPTKEWSGILFYNVTGSFEEDNLEIQCVDFFLMDIGTGGSTEFDMGPEVMSYMCYNNLTDYYTGLIHSHNSMATFFSSTDTDTLRKEGNDQNHFVSLIVNNAGTYTAAVTRKVIISREVKDNYYYNTWDNVKIDDKVKDNSYEVTEIQWFYLNIIKETPGYDFSVLDARLKEVEASKLNTSKQWDKWSRVDKDNSYQGTLFNKEDFKKPNSSYSDLLKDSAKAKEQYTTTLSKKSKSNIDDDLIKSLCIQLITGSVMITDKSNLDINQYVGQMPAVIEKRFGKGEKGEEDYSFFIESFLEYLLMSIEDIDASDAMADMAEQMYTYLTTLPENKYIDICMSKLSYYFFE